MVTKGRASDKLTLATHRGRGRLVSYLDAKAALLSRGGTGPVFVVDLLGVYNKRV